MIKAITDAKMRMRLQIGDEHRIAEREESVSLFDSLNVRI